MSIPAQPPYSQNFSMSGLQTLTFTVPVAATFTLAGKLEIPRLSQTDQTDPNYLALPSSIVTTIKQNGTTIFTSVAGADSFSIPILTAVKDSISIQLSSSNSADIVKNVPGAVISIG